MRNLILLFFLSVFAISAKSQVSHVVISQVYGAGGNSGASYKNDYVEIYNPTASPVDLTNWSVQYASSTGSSWNVNIITSGTIQPGKYFLVRLAGGSTGADVPTPDAIPANQSNMSGTSGKVALVNNSTALTGTCPTGAVIVDFVGFGSGPNCFEGTGTTPAFGGNTNALFRKNNGCTDTDNNANDFIAAAANPRNSASPANNCASNSITPGAVTTTPFCVDATTAATGTVAYSATGTYNTTFTAYLSDAAGNFTSPVNVGTATVSGTDPSGTINITIPAGTASGTGYKIRVDATSPATTGSTTGAFEIVNGAKNVLSVTPAPGNASALISWSNPNACFDEVMVVVKPGSSITATPSGDGTAYTANAAYGTGTAFDGGFVVYKGTTSPVTVTGLTNGTTYYVEVFSRKGTNWSSGVEVTLTPNVQPAPGNIVINQFSTDYGGASDEYIELVNKTNNTYDLSGLAIRYQSASGSSGGAGGTLNGMIGPNSFWLLSPNATITVGQTNNLARDGAINSGLAASAGQFALVRIVDNTIIDAVGYGTISGGTYTEGTAAPAPPADGGLKRTTDGVDTDNNSADFSTVNQADINLRNSSTVLPVRFTNIKVEQHRNGIQLSWSNATEQNIAHYAVERSASGSNFIQVAQVNAAKNNGAKANYSVVDAAPLKGDNLYRIKAVEKSGAVVYSNIVRINLDRKGIALNIYPNPVKGGEMNVQLSDLPAGKYSLRVFAVNGQEVSSRSLNHNGGNVTEIFNLGNIKRGMYTVRINGSVNLTKTFIVE